MHGPALPSDCSGWLKGEGVFLLLSDIPLQALVPTHIREKHMVEACAARVREAADKEVCVGESTARTKWSEGEIDRFKGALARLGPSSNIKLEAEIRTRTAAQVNVFKYRFLKAYLTWLKDNYHPPPVSPLVRIQSDVQTPVIPPRRPPSQTSGGRRGASDARPSPRSSAPATCGKPGSGASAAGPHRSLPKQHGPVAAERALQKRPDGISKQRMDIRQTTLPQASTHISPSSPLAPCTPSPRILTQVTNPSPPPHVPSPPHIVPPLPTLLPTPSHEALSLEPRVTPSSQLLYGRLAEDTTPTPEPVVPLSEAGALKLQRLDQVLKSLRTNTIALPFPSPSVCDVIFYSSTGSVHLSHCTEYKGCHVDTPVLEGGKLEKKGRWVTALQ